MSDSASAITVSPLSSADAADTFGLARLALPDMTVARWRRLVHRWTATGSGTAGALVARDAAGRIVGFAPYEARREMCPGRTLWVERVVAVSLVDTGPTLRALAVALADVARRQGCRRLKVETGATDSALRRVLCRSAAVARSTLVEAIV